MEKWAGVILAAGQGVRMKSRTPKVLHRVCGKEMIRYPVDLLHQSGIKLIVVVVSPLNAGAIREVLGDDVEYVTQPEVLGTADAFSRAWEMVKGRVEHVIMQGGDAPLVRLESIKRLMDCHTVQKHQMTILTGVEVATQDLGRVVRDEAGRVTAIIEAADWTGETGVPTEVNSGVYCFDASWVSDKLTTIQPSERGEKYLTALASAGDDASIKGVIVSDSTEMLGVNNRLQMSQVEAIQRQRIREQWMFAGVTMTDPASVFIDADVQIGQDTVILPNTMVLGASCVGERCEIGPNSVIKNSNLGDDCRVTASVLESSTLESNVNMGPFSHLRPGSYLESGVHIGNFVEVKNSRLGAGAASGHFTYLGDASIGAKVNIGAGTVTCNYDGKDKHVTVVGAGAFIGCDTMLVAPVTVGPDAVTGAGSVVTKDVPRGKLAIGIPAKIMSKKE